MTAQIEIVSGLSVPCCQQNIVACRAGGMIGPFAIGHEASKPHHIAACLRGEASERRCAVKEAALTFAHRIVPQSLVARGTWCGA